MKQITTVGVDLAKSVFPVRGVGAAGRTVLRKTVRHQADRRAASTIAMSEAICRRVRAKM